MGGKNVIMVMDDAEPRSGGRRLPVGRLRHDRPALHGGEPRRRPQERLRRVRRALRRRARRRCASATASIRGPRWGRRSARRSCEGDGVRRDRQGRKARGCATGGNRLTSGAYAKGFFHEPTIFADVDAGDAHRARGDLRAGRVGAAVRLARRGHRASPTTWPTACRRRSTRRTSTTPSPRCATSTPGSSTSTRRPSAPRCTCRSAAPRPPATATAKPASPRSTSSRNGSRSTSTSAAGCSARRWTLEADLRPLCGTLRTAGRVDRRRATSRTRRP